MPDLPEVEHVRRLTHCMNIPADQTIIQHGNPLSLDHPIP
jgi:hypothetical protein